MKQKPLTYSMLWLLFDLSHVALNGLKDDGVSVEKSRRIGPMRSKGHFRQSTKKNNDHAILNSTLTN